MHFSRDARKVIYEAIPVICEVREPPDVNELSSHTSHFKLSEPKLELPFQQSSDTMTAPTIVVVPAAGMPSSIYQPFVSALENHEFPVKFVEYPFMEKDAPKLPDNLLDITATRNIVKNLVDDGSNVVVFMNSYGGTVGTSALQGLGKEGQAKAGKEGGVVRLVYAAAFVFREGEMMPGKGDWEALKQLGTYDEKVSYVPFRAICYMSLPAHGF